MTRSVRMTLSSLTFFWISRSAAHKCHRTAEIFQRPAGRDLDARFGRDHRQRWHEEIPVSGGKDLKRRSYLRRSRSYVLSGDH